MAMEQRRRSIRPVPTAAVPQASGHAGDVPERQLPDYLAAMRRRWWIVACSMIAAATAALAIALLQTETYRATASLILDNSRPVEVVLQTSAGRSPDPERDVNTNTTLVRTARLAAKVKRELRLPLTVPQILDEVRATTRGNSNVLDITVEDRSPVQAAQVANAFAREYVRFRRAASRTAYLQAIGLAEKRLAGLTPRARRGAEGRSLRARLAELQTAATLQTGGVQPVDAARVPSQPAAPKPSRAVAIGAILGLILGAALAIILDFRDRRIKDDDDVEQATALDIMGRIPVRKRGAVRVAAVGGGRQRDTTSLTVQRDWPEGTEAFVALAAKLRHRGVGSGLRTVMIASAGVGDGKTSITLGTAAALARVGLRVIAVEADLRDPAFGRYVELSGQPQGAQGLVGLLGGSSSLENELVEIDPTTGIPANGKPIDRGYFGIVPSGPGASDPHALFSSPKLQAVLSAVRARADVVLVDTPAMTAASDALRVGPYVDTALFVVRIEASRKDEVARGLEGLRGVGVDLAGAVVIGG
jgi:receptor protein-tyrosine kinase